MGLPRHAVPASDRESRGYRARNRRLIAPRRQPAPPGDVIGGPGTFRYHAAGFLPIFPDGVSMKIAAIALAAAGFLASGAVLAQSAEDLIKKNGCAACHANDKKIVGPAYVDVAAKYKGDASAPAKLMEKIKKGGQGVWGPVPMPPNPTVSDADLKTMITYILTLKK